MKVCTGLKWLMVEPSGVLLRMIMNLRILQTAGNFSHTEETICS